MNRFKYVFCFWVGVTVAFASAMPSRAESGSFTDREYSCKWFDGQSEGISQRGWHLYYTINHVVFSEHFYENQGNVSEGECRRDLATIQSGANYGPIPQYGASYGCKWFDGQSFGISERGVHYYKLLNGAYFSIKSYYNGGQASEYQCYREMIENFQSSLYQNEVQRGQHSCQCAWKDGQSEGISERGVHMLYYVPILNERSRIEVPFSSQFFYNSGNVSLGDCQRALIQSNYTCY